MCKNKELFTWEPKHLVGVPRGIIEHHLKVCPNVRPVKKAWRQSTKKQSFIVQETHKLQEAGVIREVRYSEWLANPDVEKTAFLTPCWVYCCTCMPFGLHNIGVTFQRLMHIALGRQLGGNAEAYVDDIVVKSWEARTLIQDLEETFASLCKLDLRLNPEKCVFGVPSGKLLGFLVSHRGIEVTPEKLGECALLLFKLMKKKGPFERTPEADAAFQDLKRYLTSPPMMVAPRPLKPLVLYLAATPHSASAALVAVREERQSKGLPHGAPEAMAAPIEDQAPESPQPQEAPQPEEVSGSTNTPALVEHPVYFVSTVISAYPLERVLRSPNAAGRVTEWNIELQAFQLEFSTTRVIKGAALADFVGEWTDALGPEAGEDRSLSLGSEAPDGWVMHFDGAFARQDARAGAVLILPTQDKLYYVV
ncbi:uncharacterized protein [Aegilops tauschii subsp. strangulata]|uniref:uncharacterized protein n=1 Tax=Aegilops tauschii subsp. strangulata TaxID=200361 RepID=UPI003CC878FE